jgi:hypothetical protein
MRLANDRARGTVLWRASRSGRTTEVTGSRGREDWPRPSESRKAWSCQSFHWYQGSGLGAGLGVTRKSDRERMARGPCVGSLRHGCPGFASLRIHRNIAHSIVGAEKLCQVMYSANFHSDFQQADDMFTQYLDHETYN